jgi:hypothetical protein
MLNVFITVDTEFWPRSHDGDAGRYVEAVERDIHGRTPDGSFGLEFQMDILNAHGLRGVFFIESLHALVLGLGPLREIVQLVQEKGHDVQLHLHPEWLIRMRDPLVPLRATEHMHDFTEDEQTQLIGVGLQIMRDCGAESVCGFRAGNYGADRATLRALARCGIRYDTSYNAAYLGSACRIETRSPPVQPEQLEGVYEIPISYFQNLRGVRHAQIVACSSAELEYGLVQAWKRGWFSFVIVSHSFELLRRRFATEGPRVDAVVLGRFKRLCRFLDANRDKFRTCTFSDMPVLPKWSGRANRPIRMKARHTVGRMLQQARRRLLNHC